MNRRRGSFAPWAGLCAGALAWAAHHQSLSDALRFNCAAVSPVRATVAAVLALLACAAGAAVSLPLARGKALDGRVFVAQLSVASAGIFALAIALQALASFTVPGCFR